MNTSKKIRVVFDGPPSHESGRFVEVENERGEGLSFGEWKQEGEFWYLEFPNPAQLEEENLLLREFVLWLTPCADDMPEYPTYQLIGRRAKNILARLKERTANER